MRLRTTDETLYKYKKRIHTEFQYFISYRVPIGVLYSSLIYQVVIRLKKKGLFDIPLYFCFPFLIWLQAKYIGFQRNIFEIGYPAHPEVIERRRKCINDCCFFAPSMLKNEIEFMHAKIDGISSEEDLVERLLEEQKAMEKEGRNINVNRYEKVFSTTNLDFNSIVKKKKSTDPEQGKRFKIVVDHGELFLECIDPFE